MEEQRQPKNWGLWLWIFGAFSLGMLLYGCYSLYSHNYAHTVITAVVVVINMMLVISAAISDYRTR